MRRGAMPGRYAGWMARDLLAGPGLVMIAIAGLVALVTARAVAGATPESARLLVRAILQQTLFPVTLIVTARLVSGDLAQGYYRAYFSRPVSPALFYLQRWLLGGVAVLLYVPLVALAVAVRTGQLSLDPFAFQKAGLLYLLLGGATFLLSTLTRRDWIVAALLYALQVLLYTWQHAGMTLGPLARALHAALPPFHGAALGRPLPAVADLWHALAYAAAMVFAALAVLRWRPLGSGGRA